MYLFSVSMCSIQMTSFRADCDFGSWQLPVANRNGFECHPVVLSASCESSIFVSVDLLDLLLSPHFQILNGAPYSDWKVIFCVVFNLHVLRCLVVLCFQDRLQVPELRRKERTTLSVDGPQDWYLPLLGPDVVQLSKTVFLCLTTKALDPWHDSDIYSHIHRLYGQAAETHLYTLGGENLLRCGKW